MTSVCIGGVQPVSGPKRYKPPAPFTRQVAIRRDSNDFVVAYQPEDVIVFRHGNAGALRKVCTQLKWFIIEDVVPDLDDPNTL
jgi:hypothetical protein